MSMNMTDIVMAMALSGGGNGGGGGGDTAIIVEVDRYATHSGLKVPVLTKDDVLKAYNGVVSGKAVIISCTSENWHFVVDQADYLNGEVSIVIPYFSHASITYILDDSDSVNIDVSVYGENNRELEQRIEGVENRVSVLESMQKDLSYEEIARIVRAGLAEKYFRIGDQINTTYTDTQGNQYQMPFDVVAFRDVTLENGNIVPAMIIQSHYATKEEIQFDAPETSRPASEDYNGQIAQYGWNRWSKSAIRQWLNGTETAGNWWTSQNDYDVAPTQHGSVNAFMHGLPSDFLAMLKPVKVETCRNYCDTDSAESSSVYEYDTTYDTFWLASREEEYVVPNEPNHREGKVFPYWIERLTTEAIEKGEALPQNTYVSADVTHALTSHIRYRADATTSMAVCRLRSCTRSTSSLAWYVFTTGHVYGSSAYYSYRSAPACAIC